MTFARLIALASLAMSVFSSVALADSQFQLKTTNVNIPDGPNGAWVSSTIAISGAPSGAVVTGIDVYFKCTHTYSGDLIVDLNADAQGALGNRNLWNREGGSADNPTRTVNNVTTFNGLSVNRTWYLYARDMAAQDTGYIDEWSIRVYYAAPSQPDLIVSEMWMENLNTFPSVLPGDDVRLDFRAKNQGTATTIADVHMRWWWGTSSGATTNFIADGSVGTINGLSPGEEEDETDASWIIPQLTPGTYWITAKIDWDGRVSEGSNENNNTRSESFTVLGATIYDAWWTAQVDQDGDGCIRSGTLNWDPDVVDCVGTLSVFEKVYWRPSSGGSWNLITTTSPHAITNCATSDTQTRAYTFSGSCSALDWMIEVYRAGQSVPDDVMDPADDSDLNDEGAESASGDDVSPPPAITSISPNPATGSNSEQTLTINGSGFVSGATVRLREPVFGVDATKSTIFVNSGRVTCSATFGTDPTTWTAQVINPGGAMSGQSSFGVQAPFPVITSISPTSANAGGAGFALTVNGSTFHQSSEVRWNGSSRSTMPVLSPGGTLTIGLTATITASDIASAGTAVETVFSPGPGGGTSSGTNFTVTGGPSPPDIRVRVSGTTIPDNGSYSFGSTQQGAPVSRTFTIYNDGGQSLDLGLIARGPDDPQAFSHCCLSTDPIPPMGQATLGVTFLASSVGTFTSELSIASNDPDSESTYKIFLSGTAEALPPVEVLDPNYPGTTLIVGGSVTSSAELLSNYGVERQGLAADGVTRLVLRWEVPGPGTVSYAITDENGASTDVGLLSPLGGPDSGTMISTAATALNDGRRMAFAVLKAPPDFARGPSDFGETSRELHINATFAPSAGGAPVSMSRTIQLRRPPVVLMHGLWSSAGAWGWPIEDDQRFVVESYNYELSNAQSFASNSVHAPAAVLQALNVLRSQGFAGTQVDFIGHSMGGLLGRLHVSGPSYSRNRNYMGGDFHKLITLDTPHAGSPLANILVSSSNQTTIVGNTLRPVIAVGVPGEACMDCGAVHNLRTDSEQIVELPAAEVLSHAIVARGGSDVLEQVALHYLPPVMKSLVEVLEFFHVIDSIFPPALQHDLIVGRLSQEGGLASGQTSLFGLSTTVPVGAGVHFLSVTIEDRIGERAIELLNARTTDGAFAAGFPAGSGRAVPTDELDLPVGLSSGLVLISPQAGAVLEPGMPVAVEVQALPGFEPVSVLIVGPEGAAVVDGPPFSTTLQLPEGVIGEVTFQAIGIDGNGVYFTAPPVTAVAQPLALLTGITVQPSEVWLSDEVSALSLTVLGTFDDGVTRYLTSPSLGTTFQSEDGAVVLVDASGTLTAVGDGTTSIRAFNGAFSAAATVHVAIPPPLCPGDANGDGAIAFSDITSVLENWGFDYLDSTGPGDADHNGVVNFADITKVLENWNVACP